VLPVSYTWTSQFSFIPDAGDQDPLDNAIKPVPDFEHDLFLG